MARKLFTPEELEELRRADAELEESYVPTQAERDASRRRDRNARIEALPYEKRKIAENQRAYREANREKIAENQRAYYEANREKWNAYMREYRKRRKSVAAI